MFVYVVYDSLFSKFNSYLHVYRTNCLQYFLSICVFGEYLILRIVSLRNYIYDKNVTKK